MERACHEGLDPLAVAAVGVGGRPLPGADAGGGPGGGGAAGDTFTPEQRELYETLEEVRARRDLREQEALFRAGVLLGGGLAAEILSK